MHAVIAALIPLRDTSAVIARIDEWEKLDLTAYTEASANSFREAVKHLKELVASGASKTVLDEAVAQVEHTHDLLVPMNTEEPTKSGCRSALSGLAILPIATAGLLLRKRKKED